MLYGVLPNITKIKCGRSLLKCTNPRSSITDLAYIFEGGHPSYCSHAVVYKMRNQVPIFD